MQMESSELVTRATLYGAVQAGDVATIDAYFAQESVRTEVAALNVFHATHAPSAASPSRPWYRAGWGIHQFSSTGFLFGIAMRFGHVAVIEWFFSRARVATMGETLANVVPEVCRCAFMSLESGIGMEVLEMVLSSSVFLDVLSAEAQQRELNRLVHTVEQESHVAVRELVLAHGGQFPDVMDDNYYTGRHNAPFLPMELATMMATNKALDVDSSSSSMTLDHLDIARHLLSRGAGCNAIHKALWIAASKAGLNLVQVVLDHACIDVDVRDHDEGESALTCAASWVDRRNANAMEMVQLLLEYGADVRHTNNRGRTALHCAVNNMDTRMAQLLLQRGADPNAADIDGAVPLDGVAMQLLHSPQQVQLLELLLQWGAKPSLTGRDRL